MIDYATPAGQVRLLSNDVDEANLLITDGQIAAFLELNAGNVRRAAADALDTIATSEALVSKAIRTQDLQTDGAKVAAALRAHAATLRQLADTADDSDAGWDVIDTTPQLRPEHSNYPTVWGL